MDKGKINLLLKSLINLSFIISFVGIGVVNIHEDDVSSRSIQSLEINSNSSYPGETISVDYSQLKGLADYNQLKGHVLNSLDNLEGTLGNLETTESTLENVVEPNQVLADSSDSNNHTQIQISSVPSGLASEGTILTLSDGSVVNTLVDNNSGSQFVSASSLTTTSTQALKRQLSATSASSPLVTKFIITKNPNSSQPQAVPIQLNPASIQSLQQGQTLTFNTMAPGVSVLPQGAQTPTKTIRISQQGIMSPQKQLIALPVSSPKPGITKIPISPAKTSSKVTMIPVTVSKSPQRIAPAAGVSVLGKSFSDSAEYTAVPVSSGPTLITLSPSKVIKQGTVVNIYSILIFKVLYYL